MPKSGFRGVSLHKPTGRWAAKISIAGKARSLGYFATPEEASAAYNAAAAERAKLPKCKRAYGTRQLNQPAAKSARLLALMTLEDKRITLDTEQIAAAFGVSRRTVQREIGLLPRLRRELARLL